MASVAKNITASALIKEGAGKVTGIFIASTTSGTLKLWDAMTATTPVLINTFTPTAPLNIVFPEGGITFTRGLFATIANTLDVTIFYE